MIRRLIPVLLLGVACGGAPQPADPFGMVSADEPGLPVLSLRWLMQLEDKGGEVKPQEFATPTAHDDRVYVGSSAGDFFALSARDGRLVWKRPVGSVSSRPVIDRGRIYVGTDNGHMVCLDTADGREVWRYESRGPILQPPILVGDTLFFSNEADQVYALDRATGKFRWQHKAETPEEYTLRGHAGVLVHDGMVYTGFANGTVVALRANTGSVAWMSSLTGDADRFVDVDGTPVVDGDSILITSSSGGVYSLDAATGYVQWRVPIEGAAAITHDERSLYVTAAGSGVYALDRRGNVMWRQGTHGGGEPAEPMISHDYLLYTLSDAGLYVADKRTGRVHQYFDPGDGISARPGLQDDALYVVSNRGTLYAMWLRRP